MKKYFFIASTTIIFIILNYFSLNKKNTLLITTCLYLITLITYAILIHKKQTETFLNNIKSEIKQINWPTKKDINQTALMVVVIILLTSFILWIIDSLLTYIIAKLI